jgi:hypothetical protein
MPTHARTIRPTPWPFGHPRVVVEHAEREVAMEYAVALRNAGYSVALCKGPARTERGYERCVLVGGDECVAVDGADVVVAALGVRAPRKRAVLEALRLRHPDKPLVVELSPGDAEAWDELVDGLYVVVTPVEPEELVAAVDDAARAG